ncbi:MAG: nucleoside kinase [Bacteroidales bacterium]
MTSIEIICKNTGIRKEYPIGISLDKIAKDQNIKLEHDLLGAKVNNKLRELSYEVFKPKTIEFIDVNDTIGYRMYMRSLVFILFKAIRDVYPGLTLKVEHSLPIGFYCELEGIESRINKDMILQIRQRMQEIIQKNLPFVRKQIPTPEAIEIFKKNGLDEKVALFETRQELYTSVYLLEDTANYFYGYLIPSTGYIKNFYIDRYFGNGLIAVWPSYVEHLQKNSNIILRSFLKEASQGGSKLFKIFQEQKKWLEILGVPYVGKLNKEILAHGPGRLIKVSEALQEKKIASIADNIAQCKDCKIILISGPSSSGKTTFCKRLSVQLQVLGYNTAEISLDDYFVDRDKTPLDDKGEYDFESIKAIDIPFFNEQLSSLMQTQEEIEIDLPTFDFKEGKRKFLGRKLKMTPKTIIIVEGIHGLNPQLTITIPNKYKYKIFVSALTHIGIDTQNPVHSTDNRLLRRIVRDHNFRGYSATETLKRWESVRKGENKNIFPFQENADIMFNSALLFELGVLKKHAEPLLTAVPENTNEYPEAQRLLKFLSYFVHIEEKEIPPTSILREFLGESSFLY